MTTNTLVKALLGVAYSALYGLMIWMLAGTVNDPLFHALFQIAYITFICLTYDLFYPYMLMGFKSTRGSLPINRLGSFVATMDAMHEHTDLDSLLDHASKALTDLLNVESTTIFVCDILAGMPDAPQKQMIQWRHGGAVTTDSDDTSGAADPVILDESSALQGFARQHRGVLLAARSPLAVAQEMREYGGELAVSAHSEQRLLCLFLPGPQLPNSAHEKEDLHLLQFFSRQLNIAIDRIDALRRQQLRKEAAYAEKMDLLANLSANIAHEMRTPLSGVRASISGVESYLPDLLEGYRYASALEPGRFAQIRPEHLEMLENTPARIKAMVDQANTVIDLLLVNLRNRKLDRSSFTECSMAICVVEAVQTYPFKRNERQKVSYSVEKDFVFQGIPAMMIYVLFNLIKNALYSVEAACKGDIRITLERDAKSNRVVFTDTGLGMDAEALPRIFEGFFTTKSEGTGAGLPFCKRTLNSFDAQIHVSSVKGEYTTFTLEFPIAANGAGGNSGISAGTSVRQLAH